MYILFFLFGVMTGSNISSSLSTPSQLVNRNVPSANTTALRFGQIANQSLETCPKTKTFIWYPDETHSMIFERFPLSRRVPQFNPGISMKNFKHAILDAGQKLAALRLQLHAGPQDVMPNNLFKYQEQLKQYGRTRPRQILVELAGDDLYELHFGTAHLMLVGLLHYAVVFFHDSDKDQVRMTNFTLFSDVGEGFVVASGSTQLFDIPGPPHGLQTS